MTETGTHLAAQDDYRVFLDGNMWCAVGKGFENLQESNAEFAPEPDEALRLLRATETALELKRRIETMRHWKCKCCNTKFQRRTQFTPKCITCTAGAQFVYEDKGND